MVGSTQVLGTVGVDSIVGRGLIYPGRKRPCVLKHRAHTTLAIDSVYPTRAAIIEGYKLEMPFTFVRRDHHAERIRRKSITS